MLKPVLLCGGVGSRLWPISREARPKQFLSLHSDASLLIDSWRRVQGLNVAPPLVVCNNAHRFMVAQQLRDAGVSGADIVLEPCGRNTAPAIAVAALQAIEADPEAILLVLPADHVIADSGAFHAAVQRAVPLAQTGAMVAFGVPPTRPETGYGYIRRGAALREQSYTIASFVEKPGAETAAEYLRSGDYFWNSGIFLLAAQACLDELARHAPDLLAACRQAWEGAATDLDFVRLDAAAFAACPDDSIDYAVMEKTDRGAVVALDCGWSDVGSWTALWEASEADADGNVRQGDVLVQQCRNNYFRSESRLLAASGVENLIVVETSDAVLVARRDRAEQVKQLVSALKAAGRDEADVHAMVYRPWGCYETLIAGARFQVKRIVVNPGQKLSLQSHRQRAEHWVVVNGTAEVTCEDKVFTLQADQSTYIPLGHKHRLANPGPGQLELIEVQSGVYLGEDDIVRYDDLYGRGDE